MSKMPKWSLSLGHFCHFSSKMKPFESGSMKFHFLYHFHPKSKLGQNFLLTSTFFVVFLILMRGRIFFLSLYITKLK
ncbi:hypothetical protein Hanom_Chr16g01415721 [Helianthus anomalus]